MRKEKKNNLVIISIMAILIVAAALTFVFMFQVKEGNNKDISSVDAGLSQDVGSLDTSSEDTSSEYISSDTSNEDTSSKDTSSEDTSSEDTSSDTSSEDTSSEDTSSDTSSEDTSSKDTSSKDTSSDVPAPKPEPVPEPKPEPPAPPALVTDPSKAYQSKYPDMVGDGVTTRTDDTSQKIVYLTFDDGVSSNTNEILSILAQNNIKATFFVKLNRGQEHLYKNIVDQGHEIALHTDSHDYKKIYASVDAFLDDYYSIFTYIKEVTGKTPSLMRYPGGSVNSFNKATRRDIIDEMLRRGFTYHDWNIDSYDSRKGTTAQDIINETLKQADGRKKCIILMHDTNDKQKTVDALRTVIPELKARGYEFKALDSSVKPIVFGGI